MTSTTTTNMTTMVVDVHNVNVFSTHSAYTQCHRVMIYWHRATITHFHKYFKYNGTVTLFWIIYNDTVAISWIFTVFFKFESAKSTYFHNVTVVNSCRFNEMALSYFTILRFLHHWYR